MAAVGYRALRESENMHYRVVLQGRAVGGADIEHVKREFVRVTGLPAATAGDYFNGRPQAIKEGIGRADAERIAATLRAIGAAASVEREADRGADDDGGEIHIVANPLNAGPPSILPGAGGAALGASVVSRPRWARALRARLPMLAGVVVLTVGAVYFAPVVDDFVQTLMPAAAPAPVVVAKHPAVPAGSIAAPQFDAAALHGPWRCTDQRTGLATYWTYGDDGAVLFHGDSFQDGARTVTPTSDVPVRWRLVDGRLVLTDAQGGIASLAVEALTLANLRYGDSARRIDIDCRRP